jgi:glycosyltransferase involved in cell wall biosynthesis
MNSILQVVPSFHAGGVEQTTLHVANALAEQGFNSFVVSEGGILTKKLHPSVVHVCLSLNTKNPFKIFYNAEKIKKIIKNNDINIVHARSRAPAWSAYIAAKATGAHFITTYHGAYGQNFLKKHYNQVMALGNPVIVASGYMEDHVKKYYPNAQCVQIPSGIHTKFFSPDLANQAKMQELKTQWNLDNASKIILLVGRFTRIKGHKILLQAASQSAFKDQLNIVFVGDSQNPKLVNELKNQASALSIKLYIHVDEKDLRPFHGLANVVVVPTTKPEAFGRVTVEAMSMCKVVIGNDLGASSEVIGTPEWVFNHNSVTDFAQKIDAAVQLTIQQAQEIGIANRLRASSLYDVESLIEGHIQVYKRILS